MMNKLKELIPVGPYTFRFEKNRVAFDTAIDEMVSYHETAAKLGELLKGVDEASKDQAVDLTDFVPADTGMEDFLKYQSSIATLSRCINGFDPSKMGMMAVLMKSIGTVGVYGMTAMIVSDYLRGKIEGALCSDIVETVGEKFFVHKYLYYRISLPDHAAEIAGFAGEQS